MGWAGPGLAKAAHSPGLGVKRAPWPVDDMPSNVQASLASKHVAYPPARARGAVQVKGASRPDANVDCQAAYIRKWLPRCFCRPIAGDSHQDAYSVCVGGPACYEIVFISVLVAKKLGNSSCTH